MANNRLYLQCTVCRGDALCLGKWYPGSAWYGGGTLSPWADDHAGCALEAKGTGGQCFELIYEADVLYAPLALYPSKQTPENWPPPQARV